MRRSSIVLAVALAGCAAASQPHETLNTPDGARAYLLHLPARPTAGRYPLVIVLHGGSGTAAYARRETKFDEIADREGFAVAYPEGLRHHWNDGRKGNDSAPADDVAYIAALIDHLAAAYPIDPARVFVTGLSNGAIMSYRLGCELSDKIAAIAPVAGQVSASVAAHCTPSHPVALLAINGTADPMVPWRGGNVMGSRGAIVSTPESVGLFVRADRCNPDAVATWLPDRDPADGTTVQQVTYGGCTSPTAVELLNINHGGHTWPGGLQYASAALVGPVSRELSASERIWQFFTNHGRSAPGTLP